MERTIWHYAKRGCIDAVCCLLTPEAEVSVDDLDDHGVTPLMVSAECCTHRILHRSKTASNPKLPVSTLPYSGCHACASTGQN